MLALRWGAFPSPSQVTGRPHLNLVGPQAGIAAGGRLPRTDLRTLIRVRLGDEEVREAITLAWAPIVAEEARRYARSGGPREDLEAEGMLALWEALFTFDPQRHRTAPERYIHNQVHRRVRSAYREAMGYDRPAEVPLTLVQALPAQEDSFAAAERRLDLAAATAHLAPEEQHTFTEYLRLAASGAGPDEAARALAQSGGAGFAAWKKRIARVRKKVRNHLSGVPSGQN